MGFFEKEECASSVYVMTVVVLSIKMKEIKTIVMKCWLEHPSLNNTSSLAPQAKSVPLSYRLAASFVTVFTPLTYNGHIRSPPSCECRLHEAISGACI